MLQVATSIETLLRQAKLPALPVAATKLMELISREDVRFTDVTKLLLTDEALSAEVLKAANSPLFGCRNEVKSIAHALTTLGMERVTLLVVTTAFWRSIPRGFNRQAVRSWWRHSLATAFLAKFLGSKTAEESDYYYMSGLMHGAGQLALLGAFPKEYWNLLTEAAANGKAVLDCEVDMLGSNHCEVGEALLKSWGVPAELIEAARLHHDPDHGQFQTTKSVHVACCAANHLGYSVLGTGRNTAELSEDVQTVIADEVLCVEIEERVNLIEASLL